MYKAVYCTLCKTLGKQYGFLSRLTLSYDFTFLALLNMSLKDGCVSLERKRCAFNPLKKCSYCKGDDSFDLPASAAMIMLYYKICDNIDDERGIKRLGFRLIKPVFSRAHKKAAKKYPDLEENVKQFILEQTRLEKENNTQLDAMSHPTATALSKILMLCSSDPVQQKVLNRLGYCMGRYIYLLDAGCDFEDDIEHNKFNVLKNDCKNMSDVKARLEPQIYFCINEAAKAFELLEIKKYKDILGNIIYLGLEDTFKKEIVK